MRNKQNVFKSTIFCHTYMFFLFPEHFSFDLIYECNTCDLLVWSGLCVLEFCANMKRERINF